MEQTVPYASLKSYASSNHEMLYMSQLHKHVLFDGTFVSISCIMPLFIYINCVNICTKVYTSSMIEPPQREFREGSARYGMGRGGPRPVYDRERTDRSGLRRRDGPDRVPRFREYLRPRSPK